LIGNRARQLADERKWLATLQLVLERFDLSPENRSALRRSVLQLDRLFLLVVIGEFNAGKSALINALVGERLLEEGVTPTTTRLQILQYGEAPRRGADADGTDTLSAPIPLLRNLNIVDTPGTNAVFRDHERLTSEFIPQADLVLFVTSADRPFTESERAFLETIRDWGKKVVIVINKIDLLEHERDRDTLQRFVAHHATTLFGHTPTAFAVSSREALRRKVGELHHESRPALPDGSSRPVDGFDALEAYVADTLDEGERWRLKLLNPLAVGSRIVEDTRLAVAERARVFSADLQTIDDIERQLDGYHQGLRREFELRLSEIGGVLDQFENRGLRFFDDTLRLGRVPDLLNKARLQRAFEREVVDDAPQRIERHVFDLIDWMISSELRQWQAVTEHVSRRAHAYEDRVIGGSSSTFQRDRRTLMETIGRAVTQTVESYNAPHDSAAIAEGMRSAVAGAAAAQAGAIGLGAAVVTLATTTAADVTGILAAGTIAVIGMFVIPSKRKHAKADLLRRIQQMRVKLAEGLREQFDVEAARSARALADAVAPYTRFVHAENEKLSGLDRQLTEIAGHLHRLRNDIERASEYGDGV
jgi:small GTP-binding protein